jgi:signal transduction histidine kinase
MMALGDGEMAASIAHEINQPLAAIAAHGNAGLRWLTRRTPDLAEARAAFQHIVDDSRRASEVISGIRSIFKKDGRGKANGQGLRRCRRRPRSNRRRACGCFLVLILTDARRSLTRVAFRAAVRRVGNSD